MDHCQIYARRTFWELASKRKIRLAKWHIPRTWFQAKVDCFEKFFNVETLYFFRVILSFGLQEPEVWRFYLTKDALVTWWLE